MTADNPFFIEAAVEGPIDEAVLRRLVAEANGAVSAVHGLKGKSFIQQNLSRWNSAARFSPWFVLVDLDQDADCGPELIVDWLQEPAAKMCFRVAVRAVEAWLLADRGRLAAFLKVPAAKIPAHPDNEDDPKQALLRLAKYSRRKDVKTAFSIDSGRPGLQYAAFMIEFVQQHWNPERAAKRSDSLGRCRRGILKLLQG